MTEIINVDSKYFIHLYDQMNNYLKIKKIKSFFLKKEISSKTDDCYIDWKLSLYEYSQILSKFFLSHIGYIHNIPELEILNAPSNLKIENADSLYVGFHVIKGSLNLLIVENGEEYTKTLNESEILIFDCNTVCYLQKLNTKNVCISSFYVDEAKY